AIIGNTNRNTATFFGRIHTADLASCRNRAGRNYRNFHPCPFSDSQLGRIRGPFGVLKEKKLCRSGVEEPGQEWPGGIEFIHLHTRELARRASHDTFKSANVSGLAGEKVKPGYDSNNAGRRRSWKADER